MASPRYPSVPQEGVLSPIYTPTPYTPIILRSTRHGSSRSDTCSLSKRLESVEPHLEGDTTADRNNGRRPHQIPPLEQRLCPPQSASSQPCHISHRARVDLNIMAQGEGGAKAGGKVDHTGQEEHRSQQAVSHVHTIRMSRNIARKGSSWLTLFSALMRCFPNFSDRLENATPTGPEATPACSESNP